MAVEIKELVIRASIEPVSAKHSVLDSRGLEDCEQRIVEACVRQVMRIIHQSKNR